MWICANIYINATWECALNKLRLGREIIAKFHIRNLMMWRESAQTHRNFFVEISIINSQRDAIWCLHWDRLMEISFFFFGWETQTLRLIKSGEFSFALDVRRCKKKEPRAARRRVEIPSQVQERKTFPFLHTSEGREREPRWRSHKLCICHTLSTHTIYTLDISSRIAKP